MMISQREARRLRKRVTELEQMFAAQKRAYRADWPSSVVIARESVSLEVMTAIKTARKLEHGVVAVPDNNEIAFFASKL